MPDPNDDMLRHYPVKFTAGNVLIYLAPLACYGCFGAFWKVGSAIAIGIGVWRSRGFLRRAFGIALWLSIVIWGVHAKSAEDEWAGSPWLMTWWLGCFAVRWHADGVKAEEDAARPEREWD
jgi:hypothetical protein